MAPQLVSLQLALTKTYGFPWGLPPPRTPHIEFSYLKICIFHYKRFSKGQDKTGDSGQRTEQSTGQDRTREQDKTSPDSGEDGRQDRGPDMGTWQGTREGGMIGHDRGHFRT